MLTKRGGGVLRACEGEDVLGSLKAGGKRRHAHMLADQGDGLMSVKLIAAASAAAIDHAQPKPLAFSLRLCRAQAQHHGDGQYADHDA
jgi:hypothetical protein